MGKSMLANTSILNWSKILIDLTLIDLLTNILAQFVPCFRVIRYTYIERMDYKFSKIESFKTNKYGWFMV